MNRMIRRWILSFALLAAVPFAYAEDDAVDVHINPVGRPFLPRLQLDPNLRLRAGDAIDGVQIETRLDLNLRNLLQWEGVGSGWNFARIKGGVGINTNDAEKSSADVEVIPVSWLQSGATALVYGLQIGSTQFFTDPLVGVSRGLGLTAVEVPIGLFLPAKDSGDIEIKLLAAVEFLKIRHQEMNNLSKEGGRTDLSRRGGRTDLDVFEVDAVAGAGYRLSEDWLIGVEGGFDGNHEDERYFLNLKVAYQDWIEGYVVGEHIKRELPGFDLDAYEPNQIHLWQLGAGMRVILFRPEKNEGYANMNDKEEK